MANWLETIPALRRPHRRALPARLARRARARVPRARGRSPCPPRSRWASSPAAATVAQRVGIALGLLAARRRRPLARRAPRGLARRPPRRSRHDADVLDADAGACSAGRVPTSSARSPRRGHRPRDDPAGDRAPRRARRQPRRGLPPQPDPALPRHRQLLDRQPDVLSQRVPRLDRDSAAARRRRRAARHQRRDRRPRRRRVAGRRASRSCVTRSAPHASSRMPPGWPPRPSCPSRRSSSGGGSCGRTSWPRPSPRGPSPSCSGPRAGAGARLGQWLGFAAARPRTRADPAERPGRPGRSSPSSGSSRPACAAGRAAALVLAGGGPRPRPRRRRRRGRARCRADRVGPARVDPVLRVEGPRPPSGTPSSRSSADASRYRSSCGGCSCSWPSGRRGSSGAPGPRCRSSRCGSACVVLYVMAASSTSSWTSLVTGYWYNDKVRLASLAAVPGVVLVAAAAPSVRGLLREGAAPARPGPAVAVVALALIPLGTVVLNGATRSHLLDNFFRPANPAAVILSPQAQSSLRSPGPSDPRGRGRRRADRRTASPLMYALFGTNTPLPLDPDPDDGRRDRHRHRLQRHGAPAGRVRGPEAARHPLGDRLAARLLARPAGADRPASRTSPRRRASRRSRPPVDYTLYRIQACGLDRLAAVRRVGRGEVSRHTS